MCYDATYMNAYAEKLLPDILLPGVYNKTRYTYRTLCIQSPLLPRKLWESAALHNTCVDKRIYEAKRLLPFAVNNERKIRWPITSAIWCNSFMFLDFALGTPLHPRVIFLTA